MKRHTTDRSCLGSLFASRSIAAAAFSLLLSAVAFPALAVTTTWTGSSAGGNFNDPANWDAGVPGSTAADDLAIFNSATNVNGTVTFSADASHGRTFVQDTAGVISFDVGPHMWTMSSFALVGVAGGTDAPTMRVIGGKVQSDRILLGGEVTNTRPSIELTGSTTHWHTTFTSAGPQVGLGATGSSILVHNGAKLSGVGQAIVGLTGAKDGSLTVDGVGSSLELGNYIAAGHTGGATPADNNKVEVLNGATAKAANIYMAITTGAPNNLIRVSGEGSTLNLVGTSATDDGRESRVGWAAPTNVLRIEDGGAVTGTNTFLIGRDATSNAGNQLIIDDGSLTGTGIEVRRGSLSVTNGTVDLTQWYDENEMLYKGGGINVPLASGAGSVAFNSGTIHSVNANFALVESGPAFTIGDGGAVPATYIMRKDHAGNNGIHTFANGLELAANGILAGSGDIVGNVSGAAGSSVEVGASPGLMNVTGDWDNTNMSLYLEIDNLLASSVPGVGFDQLNVSGAFTHGGSVTIDVAEFVYPLSGPTIKLIGWGSEVGSTASTSVSFIGGPALGYSFESDGLYVTVVPEPAALALLGIGLALVGSTTRRRETTR